MPAPKPGWPSRWTAAAFVLSVASACGPTVNEVLVQPGSTPTTPVFVLTDTTGRGPSGLIYGLSVLRCGSDSSAWTIVALGSRTSPDRIVYGETPEGYATSAGPQPLRSGCYDVYVTDGRRTRFRIDGTGRLVVATPHRDSVRARPDSAPR